MGLKKSLPYLLPLLPIVFIILFWQIFSEVGIIDSALFSCPSKIISQLLKVRSELLIHLSTTVYRLFTSFLIALAIGIGIGVLMGANRFIYRFFDPLISTIMGIPGIAMAPLFIVWFGFGNPTIITIGIIVAFFPIVYNTAMGVRSIDKQLVRAAKIMGANRKTIFMRVYLPSSAAYIFNGVKLGLARCWRTVIAVEFIAAANYGLGYMIWDSYEYLRVDVVYGGIIILALFFFFIEKVVIKEIEKRTIEKWGVVREYG